MILHVAFFSLLSLSATQLDCPPNIESEVAGSDLKIWRETLISGVLEGLHTDVRRTIQRCFPRELPSCLQDLVEYNRMVEQNLRVNQPRLDCKNKILPSVDALPPEFIHRQGDEKFLRFPKNLETIAKEKGWKTALYKTRSSGGFDGSPLLYLAVIPGTQNNGMIDHYLQISPTEDKSPTGSDDPTVKARDDNPHIGRANLTIISVDRSKNPPVGQLKMLKQYDENRNYAWNNDIRADCYECHTVPLKALSPVGFGQLNAPEIAMSKAEQENIRAINEMMNIPNLSWGTCEQNGKMTPLGPRLDSHPIGWAPKGSITRKKEFIENCVKNTDRSTQYWAAASNYNKQFKTAPNFPQNVDRDKIAKAMNCIECHDNTKRGYLHAGIEAKEITFKVLVDRSMPLGFDSMNVDERMVLLTCLNMEKRELLSQQAWRKSGEWMRRRFCEDFQIKEAISEIKAQGGNR